MSKEPEDPGFTVTDKRHFREDGEVRQEPAPEAAREPDAFRIVESARGAEQAAPGTSAKIDFPSYILSYYTQALVFLGEVPNPMTNQKEQDLETAHHMIDILSMLQEKTRGNLSKEEQQLLESVLYELRMKFMAKTNRIKI